MLSGCGPASRNALLPAQFGPPRWFSQDCLFPPGSDSAPGSCFHLRLFPAMLQLMHIPALLLLGSFPPPPRPSLSRENACFAEAAGKQRAQLSGCPRGCSASAYRGSAGKLRREAHLQSAHKRGLQGSCPTYFTANTETRAICSHLLCSLYKPRDGTLC